MARGAGYQAGVECPHCVAKDREIAELKSVLRDAADLATGAVSECEELEMSLQGITNRIGALR